MFESEGKVLEMFFEVEAVVTFVLYLFVVLMIIKLFLFMFRKKSVVSRSRIVGKKLKGRKRDFTNEVKYS